MFSNAGSLNDILRYSWMVFVLICPDAKSQVMSHRADVGLADHANDAKLLRCFQ